MKQTEPALPASRCPLCGGDNGCAVASGCGNDSDCWCFSASIPHSALSGIPKSSRDEACICPRCAGVKMPSASNTTE